MSRCFYLDYNSGGFFSSNDKYVCRLCMQEFPINSPQVKYTCNSESGEEYKKCEIYKNYRK